MRIKKIFLLFLIFYVLFSQLVWAQTVKNNSYVLDSNTTPVYIEDAKDFVKKVTQKHYEIINEYADEYKRITT